MDGEVVGVATRDVFSEAELGRLRGFPEITRAELIRYFTLTSAEEEFLRKFLGRRNVLGASVQLCTLPWLGFVPDDVGAAPPVAVDRLAERVAIPAAELAGYGERGQTRTDHLREIVRYSGWRPAGAPEWDIDNGSFRCTAGLAVTKGTVRGMTTAGHCDNAMWWQPSLTDGSKRFSMTFKAEHEGEWGDVQWHTSSKYISDDFFEDWGKRRDASGAGNPVLGQYLCKFGQSSGPTCDNVRDTNRCNDGYCHLVMMEHRRAAGGDSGGPWFNKGSVMGIHHGYLGVIRKRDLMTPIRGLGPALGVSIALK